MLGVQLASFEERKRRWPSVVESAEDRDYAIAWMATDYFQNGEVSPLQPDGDYSG